MAVVVSLINMKGGVGKTTIAAQLAHSAQMDKYRVLAIDLDPQSNLSHALMGAREYVSHLQHDKPTVAQVLDNYIPTSPFSGSPRPLDVNEVIVSLRTHQSVYPLNLIPSRLELSRTLKNPMGKERRLAKCLAKVSDQYDLILIDCAPTESVLTQATYFASRYVIVPIKPEFMATIGLPLLVRSIEEFRLENDDHQIDIAGLCFVESSYYNDGPEAQASKNEVKKQALQHDWYVFDSEIRHSASYPRASREALPIAATPYCQFQVSEEFNEFKDEVFKIIGLI
ncbi:MAG: ParA family protein [Gammaproteobacteria bacterium]|nr:ParA family protein [Gammaproteobacteria bacterium]